MTLRADGAFRKANAGFSLVEALIVVAVLGLLLAITTPKIRDASIRSNVRGARGAVANLYARARVTAIQTRKITTLRFNGNSAVITVPGVGKLDTIGAVMNLNNEYGVTLTTTGDITVLPTGMVNATVPKKVMVSKSGKSDSLMIMGYGRMQ